MTPGPPVPGPASSVEAARAAVAHVRRDLFPFRLDRWFALGFVAFLDQCGRAGGGFGTAGGGGGEGKGDGGDAALATAIEWLSSHPAVVVLAAALLLTLVVAVTALVLWVGSRGTFMYLDNVATGRADVARPWSEHAERAGSYFVWSFGIALVTLVAVVLLLALVFVAIVSVEKGGSGRQVVALVAAVAGAALLLGVLLLAALASLALRDFVAPLQLQAGVACGDAVRLFLGLLRRQPGLFLAYVLLKLVFSIAFGMALLVAACFTCCCILIPVVTQTAFQPAFYFERAWPLHILRQLGHDLVGGGSSAAASGVATFGRGGSRQVSG